MTAIASETTVRGARIGAQALTVRVGNDLTLLHDVSFAIEPGELVAIVGGSGAGKTTLLNALSGVRPASSGTVTYDDVSVYDNLELVRSSLGYVPQDDIVHLELPVERTLRYAAQLRIRGDADVLDARVAETIDAVNLAPRRDVPVGALSGGQRKRVSIGVELLTRPRVFFLDEPTSGLDPATSADIVRRLQALARSGSTVVFTTHAVQDLTHCDRVVVLATGGHLAFSGSVDAALEHFGADNLEAVYELLAQREPQEWAADFRAPDQASTVTPSGPAAVDAHRRVGAVRQWAVLSRRAAEALVRNKLTLAILLGSPALVVAMFAVLFQPGAFDFDDPSPSATIMIIFWIAFGGFFFGLTYGLLQICTEMPILRRERMVGLRLGSYLLSKLTVLLPFLLLVDLLMLGVLRALNRLPSMGAGTFASLAVTLMLDATAALALGLLASAAVGNPSQATLALPMLCFPAVLFSGAILPVAEMARAGQIISIFMIDRWAFEAIGRTLGLRRLFAEGGSPLGPPLLETYGDAGTWSVGVYWAILLAFIVVFLIAAWLVLVAKCRPR
jgi:ABC-type multidrug transport system ATPase subunit